MSGERDDGAGRGLWWAGRELRLLLGAYEGAPKYLEAAVLSLLLLTTSRTKC